MLTNWVSATTRATSLRTTPTTRPRSVQDSDGSSSTVGQSGDTNTANVRSASDRANTVMSFRVLTTRPTSGQRRQLSIVDQTMAIQCAAVDQCYWDREQCTSHQSHASTVNGNHGSSLAGRRQQHERCHATGDANLADVNQSGTGNFSGILRTLPTTRLRSTSQSADNSSNISQSGDLNTATVTQSATSNNTSTVNQSGFSNTATVSQ